MRYFTQCPACETVYQLNLMELNITQGMVRCAHCQHAFDAYSYFIADPNYLPPPCTNPVLEFLSHRASKPLPNIPKPEHDLNNPHLQHVHHLMVQNVEGSRLNLYTYLNYLDTLNPVHSHPDTHYQHSSQKQSNLPQQTYAPKKKRKILYYVIWSVINLLLISLLIAQFIFLPQF